MNQLPKRKQIRLPHYDYSQNGYYFITICTKDRQPILSEIHPNDLQNHVGADIIRPKLTKYGEIVEKAIKTIPLHYPNFKIDQYVIMPDHVHFILIIENGRMISAPTKTIMTVIGQMKRWASKESGISLWQKSYFEHIIRDEADYLEKTEYILNNPLKLILS